MNSFRATHRDHILPDLQSPILKGLQVFCRQEDRNDVAATFTKATSLPILAQDKLRDFGLAAPEDSELFTQFFHVLLIALQRTIRETLLGRMVGV